MREFLQNFVDFSKELLQKDGFLVPIMMWFRNKQPIVDPQIFIDFKDANAYETKTRNTFIAGVLAKKFNADLVVLVQDGAFRILDIKKKMEMDITESPLTYPRSMRTECLLINGIPLPEGEEEIIIVPYKGGEGEPVEFLPELPKNLTFEYRFTELVRRGYSFI